MKWLTVNSNVALSLPPPAPTISYVLEIVYVESAGVILIPVPFSERQEANFQRKCICGSIYGACQLLTLITISFLFFKITFFLLLQLETEKNHILLHIGRMF